jgi:hypothetical protein
LSVNVGMPRDIEWEGRTVRTAVWKDPVEGRRMVRRLNVDGDRQGDLQGHGGPNRAGFVYQIASYRDWQQFRGRDDFVHGQFGENFTPEGLADDEVCIGDPLPDRLGAVRGQRAAGHVLPGRDQDGRAADALCWLRSAAQASISGFSRKAKWGRATGSGWSSVALRR